MPYKDINKRKEYAALWRQKNAKDYYIQWKLKNPDYSYKKYQKKIKPFTKKPAHTTELSGRDFTREKVRIRDNHTCQDCKKVWEQGTRRFDVHHLNGLCGKKSRGYDNSSEMDGLITLCHRCHFNRPEHTKNLK